MKFPYKNPHVATRSIDDEAVAISSDNHVLHKMNKAGTRIWEMANGSLGIEAIAERIAGEFDVDFDTALADVEDFCRELTGLEILAISDSPKED